MRKFNSIAALFFIAVSVLGRPLIPTKPGTTWLYDVTDEAGGGSDPAQSQIHYRVTGRQEFGGKELLRLQTFVGDVVIKTELLTIDQQGIRLFAHTGKDGNMIGFVAPQVILPETLKKGASWNCVDEIADIRVEEHFTVADTEKISVPAGNFQAFHIHCQEPAPMSVIVDRWFADGIGFVKEITTLRSPTGDLLHRRTLELAKLPAPEAKTNTAIKKLSVGVSSQQMGEFENVFPSDTRNIYARWVGRGLRENSKVRAVWIAEDVGDIAPPNYKIDEASAIATSPDAHGLFTLSRPEDGWAHGNYRVEFYLDDALVETVKLEIK